MSNIKSTLIQPWTIKIGLELVHTWADAGQVIANLSNPYSGASKLATKISQLYNSNILLSSVLTHSYGFFINKQCILEAFYAVTEKPLYNWLHNIYRIREVNIASTHLNTSYLLTGNVSLKTLQTQYISISGESVYPVSVELKSSIDQYGITASIEVESYTIMKKFVPGIEITLYNVLNTNFTLVVDAYDYDLSFDSDTYKVDLISPAALLDSPFANLINGDYIGMASAICQNLAGSITVHWNIIDWYIGDGILSASEETPLSVIRKIVNAVGGIIQSLPDGSITVISRYPKSCNTWISQPIVYSINYNEDVISERFTLENAPGYNNFSIQDDSTSSTLLRVEVEEIDSNSKTVKVFVYPDVVPLISHSGNTDTVSLNYIGYITENVEEEAEFVSGESSVDGPINGINYSSWKYSDLGSVTYETTGVLYSAVTGESLLDISYKTGYYSYTVSTSVLENIQIIVEANI